jgi:hypothetical protein
MWGDMGARLAVARCVAAAFSLYMGELARLPVPNIWLRSAFLSGPTRLLSCWACQGSFRSKNVSFHFLSLPIFWDGDQEL